MHLKKAISFIVLLFCTIHADANAKQVALPVDTVALQAALSQITMIGDNNERDEDKLNTGKADLYLYFMENSNKKLSSKNIIQQCKKIIRNSVSCMKFIEMYNSYMDHANNCLTANNFSINGNPYRGDHHKETYTFQECFSLIDPNYHKADGSVDTRLIEENIGGYKGTSIMGQCKQWVDAANICQKYLINLYSQKLEKTKDTNTKNIYTCVVEKIRSGEISFPLDRKKLEEDCDPVYQRIKAIGDYEMMMAM